MEENKKQPIIKNPKEVAKALEVLFASDYIDVRKLHIENFIRGIFFGAGTVIGATVFIAIIVWFLSIFDTVPLIGPLFDNTKETIQQTR
ncbi:hypothetical protein HZB74_02545 [Candidatus Saccharibacteria bacterium]|nr:hypothetical protein [Candidatus Saccharibacteria bacterium]